MDLDDYSLRHVFSFLKGVREKATCLRFRPIIGPLIGKQEINHNLLRKRFGDPKQFYANYGIYIKKIYIYLTKDPNEFFNLIPKYCHNIEKATVGFFDNLDSESLKNIFASNKCIKHLKLFSTSPYMADIAPEHLGRLQTLETLALECCSNLTGEHLYRLTNLNELNLKGCRKLNSDHFIGFCEAKKLFKLNIFGCRKLNTEAFRTLVETQTELEEIHVDSWYKFGEIGRIALLENLRSIHIYSRVGLEENSKSLLRELSEYRASALKYLKIECSRCVGPPYKDLERIQKFENLEELAVLGATNLNDSVLTRISKACKQLQRVEVISCHQITNEGILQLIRSLKLLTVLKLNYCINLCGELYQDMCEAKRTSGGKRILKVHACNDFLSNVTDEQIRINHNLVQLFRGLKPFDVSKWKPICV